MTQEVENRFGTYTEEMRVDILPNNNIITDDKKEDVMLEPQHKMEKSTTPSSCKRHRRKASLIERKYCCSYPGCKKAYGTCSSLHLHEKVKHRLGIRNMSGNNIPEISPLLLGYNHHPSSQLCSYNKKVLLPPNPFRRMSSSASKVPISPASGLAAPLYYSPLMFFPRILQSMNNMSCSNLVYPDLSIEDSSLDNIDNNSDHSIDNYSLFDNNEELNSPWNSPWLEEKDTEKVVSQLMNDPWISYLLSDDYE